MKSSTSLRSWRQNLAQGEVSAESGTLGHGTLYSLVKFGEVPRAALRFTSFRFACPALNSAAGYASSLSLLLLLFTIACKKEQPNQPTVAIQSPVTGQSPAANQSQPATPETYPALVAQAQEVNEAFRRRDFARMVDLTYPKVIESAGGRDKMIAALARGLKEMESEGVSVLSSTSGAPTQIVHVSEWTYAVVPTTLKVRAKDGIFQTESSMIGISADKGAHWTFIDAGGKDHAQLKSLLPAPTDQLNLPVEKEPVKDAGN